MNDDGEADAGRTGLLLAHVTLVMLVDAGVLEPERLLAVADGMESTLKDTPGSVSERLRVIDILRLCAEDRPLR